MGGTAYVIRLRDGQPESVRKIPRDDFSSLTAALEPSSGRIFVLAPPRSFDAIQNALSGEGRSISRDPDGWATAEEGAAARAGVEDLRLVTPSLREEQLGQRRRRALVMLAGPAPAQLLAWAQGDLYRPAVAVGPESCIHCWCSD